MGRIFIASQTDAKPIRWGLLCFVAGNCLNSAYNVKKRTMATPNTPEPYWFVSMLTVIINGYGGGILAPILLGKPIIPAVFDPIVPLCIAAWYITHIVPKGYQLLDWLPVKIFWTILLALFRTMTACNIIEGAMDVLKPTEFYPSCPLFGPIMVGATLGCAGQFLPFDKGLKVIESGMPWQVQGAIMGSTFFHLCVHDKTGIFGSSLRFLVLNVVVFVGKLIAFKIPNTIATISEERLFNKENVRSMICVMHLVQLLGIATLNNPDFNIFRGVHTILYKITGVPRFSKSTKSAESSSSSSNINGGSFISGSSSNNNNSNSNSSDIGGSAIRSTLSSSILIASDSNAQNTNPSSNSNSSSGSKANFKNFIASPEKINEINKSGSTINRRINQNNNGKVKGNLNDSKKDK